MSGTIYWTVADGHPFPHDPFNAIVTPRPIGWIGTLSAAGTVNLAPFSYFNALSAKPPLIMFCANAAHADGGEKDSLANCRATGEFTASLATLALAQAVNKTSVPAARGVDEMQLAGLTAAPSRLIRPPSVGESPARLECAVHQIIDLPSCPRTGQRNTMVIGRVLAFHLDASFVTEAGLVDIVRARPLSRLGYFDYAAVERVFEMRRPEWPQVGVE